MSTAQTVPKERTKVYVRFMALRDLSGIVRVEEMSFDFPWERKDFLRCKEAANCSIMVAESATGDKILGYMIYEIFNDKFHLVNFAVHPDWRRQEIGRQMLEELFKKVSPNKRKRIELEVRETNLPAQLFFAACGFRATCVLRVFYPETKEDAYQMRYEFTPKTLPS